VTSGERLADELARAASGDAWHGPSLAALLDDVTAAEAARRPIAGAHTIWELVLHLTAWTGEVRRRLGGGEPGEPGEGDWPEPPAATPEAWAAARAALAAAHAALQADVLHVDDAQLDRPVGGTRDLPLGSGGPHGVMLHGLAQHDAYHGGQIALLKKAARA
jgi:uncharacterized damage-inducible protein DinB